MKCMPDSNFKPFSRHSLSNNQFSLVYPHALVVFARGADSKMAGSLLGLAYIISVGIGAWQ